MLPPFEAQKSGRDFFALHARRQHPSPPLSDSTASIIRDSLKLVVDEGYKQLGAKTVELYDLSADPEERVNLYPERSDLAAPLMDTFNKLLVGHAQSRS
jgi:hypothetical protein